MSQNSKSIGELSEAMVLTMFLRKGKAVLQPFGDNQRYDLVIDDGGKFIRVQCKTGRIKDGCIKFSAHSSQRHRGKGSKGYKGQADVFAVYCPDNEKVYVVPIEDVGESNIKLRLVPTKNNQKKFVRLASLYEL